MGLQFNPLNNQWTEVTQWVSLVLSFTKDTEGQGPALATRTSERKHQRWYSHSGLPDSELCSSPQGHSNSSKELRDISGATQFDRFYWSHTMCLILEEALEMQYHRNSPCLATFRVQWIQLCSLFIQQTSVESLYARSRPNSKCSKMQQWAKKAVILSL